MQKMSFKYRMIAFLLIIVFALGITPVLTVQAAINPPTLEEFSTTLKKSDSSQLVGVYVYDILALKVVQQASTYSVSSKVGTATQFTLAGKYGSIGLLAHNYLSGSSFLNLVSDSEIILIFGDGSTKKYKVETIMKYQALNPNDNFSNFINLDKPNATITSDNVVNETYGAGDLVLQTCIARNGILNWGRLFIIASLVE
jgi:hypothetical protein